MLHPFAGIIGSAQADESPGGGSASPQPSRREALGVLAGVAAGAAAVAAQAELHADEPRNPAALRQPGNGKPAGGFALYFVQPRELSKFSEAKRKQLGVTGPYRGRWPENHRFQDKRGYLAWLSAGAAARLGSTPGIQGVHQFAAGDVLEHGQRNAASTRLTVFLSPNSWRTRPANGTYQPIATLVKQWDAISNATFSVHQKSKSIQVQFRGGVDKKLLQAIRSSGQVHAVTWGNAGGGNDGPVTTQALGEEGGPTTLAIGEEGGPTTLAIGEEGGPTTNRLGEEGGATTKRLGEEGGVTTKAIGEEGGPKPSTRRLGEEGGITTKALGEEGGPRRQ